MSFTLPALPYALDSLAPFLSKETLEYHYGKHHRGYVDTLNKLTEGSELANHSLEDLILSQTGAIFNQAAQIWNHTFYWQSLTPHFKKPSSDMLHHLAQSFGSFEKFKQIFTQTALTTFGSGWTWLVKEKEGQLAIVSTHNAGNPMTQGQKALLTCDVWEHAYYIDYRNARAHYLEQFWDYVHWEGVAQHMGI